MKRDAVVNLRMPTELKAALERAAEEDFRTLSSLAVALLMRSMLQRGYLRPTKSKRKS